MTLFTRGKAPVTQQLPGESDSDFADFSSKVTKCKCKHWTNLPIRHDVNVWLFTFVTLVLGVFTLVLLISQILHLKGDRKDFDFVKSSLSAQGFDVVYDINGVQIPTCSHLLCLLFTYNFLIYVTLQVPIMIFLHNIPLFRFK